VVELAEDGEEEERGTMSGVGERSRCPGGPDTGGRWRRPRRPAPDTSDASSSPCARPSFFSHDGEQRGRVEVHPKSGTKLRRAIERRTQWRRAPCCAGSVRNSSR
jgi:hypothetical protein